MPRWVFLAALVGLGLLLAQIASVSAVNQTGAFELEGNALTDNAGAGAPDDWDRVCYDQAIEDGLTATDAQARCTASTGTNGAVATFWVDAQANPTIFTGGGSKDPQPIDKWLWKPADTVPDKDTLRHAFAARYSLNSSATCPGPGGNTDGTTKCEVIFFGMDRFANDGDAQLGFWFFQDDVGLTDPPVASQGGFRFVGEHRNGDLLLISNFSNGGTTSTISAYFWDTSCTKAASNSPAAGDCAAANLRLQSISSNANCGTSAPTSNFCGIVNPTDGTTAPWSYLDKKGNSTYLQGEFYEGGVNLSGLGIGDNCFSAVAAESRASTSPTSVLKDIVIGGFGECGSTTVTTPSDNQATPQPITTNPVIPANGTLQVTDKAVVTVTGIQNFGGSVAFHLCGPADLAPTTNVTQTTCAAGGTKIGVDKTVSGPSPATVFSDAATITKAGKYCWRAVYSGDATKGVPTSSDSSATECFTVDPRQPTLTTQAVDANGDNVTSVPLGTTLYDKATLGNTANRPGSAGPGPGDASIDPITAGTTARGTITFKLYGPTATAVSSGATDTAFATACGTLASGFPAAGITVNVTGGNGTYGGPTSSPIVGFAPTSAGYFHWKAEYSGDLPNTLTASHNANCTEGTERVQVLSLQTSLTTRQFVYPQDSAKITVGAGGGDLAGNVRFTLHDDATECLNGTDIKYDSGNIAVAGASGQIKATNNQTYRIVDGTTHYWNVSYVSTNSAHVGSTSVCAEETDVTFVGNDTGITLP